MATKAKGVYCSAILTNGMEYMIKVPSDVTLWGAEEGAVVGKTLDGKSIVIPTHSAVVFREVSNEEFEIWQKSLEKYREEKLKEAQVSNLSVN